MNVQLRRMFVTLEQEDGEYAICREFGATLRVEFDADESDGELRGCVDAVVTQGELTLWPLVVSTALEAAQEAKQLVSGCSRSA